MNLLVRPELIIFVLLIFGGCSRAPSEFQNNSDFPSDLSHNRIINGNLPQTNDPLAQSTVAISESIQGQICSGVLLSPEFILTAAHCAYGFKGSLKVHFSSDIRDNSNKNLVHAVAEVLAYEGWETRAIQGKDTGDLAILRFEGGLPAGYRPAQILPAHLAKHLRIESIVDVLGYGRTDSQNQYSAGVLYKTQLEVLNPHFAATEFILDQHKGTGICHGDSGGPVFLKVENKLYLAGISSRGMLDLNRNCDQLSVVTKTWMYSAWIARTLKKFKK